MKEFLKKNRISRRSLEDILWLADDSSNDGKVMIPVRTINLLLDVDPIIRFVLQLEKAGLANRTGIGEHIVVPQETIKKIRAFLNEKPNNVISFNDYRSSKKR